MAHIVAKKEWPEIVPFRPIREVWSRYSVDEGAIEVACRAVLLSVAPVRGPGVPEGALELHPQFLQAVVAEDRHRGPPNPIPIDLHAAERKARPVPFDRLEEPENIYVLSNPERVFRTRLLASDIKLVPDLYDALGLPFFLVNFQLGSSLARPPEPGEIP